MLGASAGWMEWPHPKEGQKESHMLLPDLRETIFPDTGVPERRCWKGRFEVNHSLRPRSDARKGDWRRGRCQVIDVSHKGSTKRDGMDPARLTASGRLIERRGDSVSASVIGFDTAKNVCQVHGIYERGRVVLRRRLRRGQLTDFFATFQSVQSALKQPKVRTIGHGCWQPSARLSSRMQALHRIRSRLIGCRTQASNQIRGLLAEYGIVLPPNLANVRQALPLLMDDAEQRAHLRTPLPLRSEA